MVLLLLFLVGGVASSARFVRRPAVELVFEVFGAQNGYFHEQEFTRYAARFCIIQDGPYRDLKERSGTNNAKSIS